MLQYLILLELSPDDVSYSSDGLRQKLQSQCGNEVNIPGQEEFDALLMGMAMKGLIGVRNGSLTIEQSGRSKLQNNSFLIWLANLLEKTESIS